MKDDQILGLIAIVHLLSSNIKIKTVNSFLAMKITRFQAKDNWHDEKYKVMMTHSLRQVVDKHRTQNSCQSKDPTHTSKTKIVKKGNEQ